MGGVFDRGVVSQRVMPNDRDVTHIDDLPDTASRASAG
jgi:hypothetical protein